MAHVELDVEVAVTDVEGVRVARTARARRVELCVALEVGGLTPSLALVERAVEAADGMGVHVLIRSRPGDFVPDAEELAVDLRDAELVLRAGAAGVVVGPLQADGRFDRDALKRFREIAADAELSAHRGFDVHPGVEENVADLLDVGLDRVLTSGGAASAHDGTDRIARAVTAADGRITVMAGGGLVPDRVRDLVQRTGVGDVHLSARTLVTADDGFGPRYRTDPAVLAQVIAQVIA